MQRLCACRVVVGQRVWVAMPLGVATAIALQECISMQLPSGQTSSPNPFGHCCKYIQRISCCHSNAAFTLYWQLDDEYTEHAPWLTGISVHLLQVKGYAKSGLYLQIAFWLHKAMLQSIWKHIPLQTLYIHIGLS